MIRFVINGFVWMWRYGLALLIFGFVLVFLVPRSTVRISDQWQAIAYEVSPYQFDYIGWEIGALAAKAQQTLFGQHPFMTEADRSQLVRDYMADLAYAQQLESQISAMYIDPSVSDADAESADLRAERYALRVDLIARQTTVEAILEGQVAAVLVDAGFGVAGQLLPPLSMRFTRVPNLLITSPRDEIRMETSINLYPLPVDSIVEIEDRIEERYDVSALIVSLGGIALYPAMVVENTSINWAVETFAHEWLHHYLYFYPLGFDYITNPDGFAGESRTINETTADLFGKEIAERVLERYYPDLVPPPPTPRATEVTVTPDPNAFDFAAEMHETRVTVDEFLEAGEVEAAETYMDERREFFYENGYRIRELNQAFFAFYGGYQAGGGVPGVGGEDPVGPAIQSIRENSDTLLAFVTTMRDITTRDTLIATQNRLEN